MQFSDYLASGGPERLLIIVGAVLIGYWGYRIHARSRNAGLALLGLAGVVLLAALFTATRPVYQATKFAGQPSAAPAPLSTMPAEEQAGPEQVRDSAVAPADVATRASGTAAEPASPSVASPSAPPPSATADEHGTKLASGDELGGRIVSVRGGNVSLEWTSPPAAAEQKSPSALPQPEVSPSPSP